MDWLNQALFGFYPYIALSALAIGSVLRFDREQYTWRTGSSQLLRRKQLVLGSVLFHIGILAIFAGHFVGLLTPIAVWDALGVSHAAKQMLAVGAGGLAGLMCLAGGLLLLHRREIVKLISGVRKEGMTIVPLAIFFNARGKAKVELGLAKGRNKADKREAIKQRDWQRDKARVLRDRG